MTLDLLLEQIHVSARSIGQQEFAPSGPFTNALLHNQEITALIRDTEPHERGLFSVEPARRGSLATVTQSGGGTAGASASQRVTYNESSNHASIVARVLGSDLLRKIQSSSQEGTRGRRVNVDILLQGAEKLCNAYHIPGTMDRIAAARIKHDSSLESIRHVEAQLSRQQALPSPSETRVTAFHTVQSELSTPSGSASNAAPNDIDADIMAGEEAVRQLQDRKRALEARLAGLDKDLQDLQI